MSWKAELWARSAYWAWTLIWIAIASVIIYGLLYVIIGLLLAGREYHLLPVLAVCLAIAYVSWRRGQLRKESEDKQ